MPSSFQEQIELLNDSIKETPDNFNLWIRKGKILSRNKKNNEAAECFNKAISINSNNPEVWDAKGNFLAANEKYPEALECFNKMIILAPSEPRAYDLKGGVLEKLNKYPEALECYQKVFELNPQAITTYINLAEVYNNLNKKDMAIQYYKHYLALVPESNYAKKRLLELKEPIEDDYRKYRPFSYISPEDFQKKFGLDPPPILYSLLQYAFFSSNPIAFYNLAIGCELFPWIFSLNKNEIRTNGEIKEYFPIFRKTQNRSYGVLQKTKDILAFASFENDSKDLKIIKLNLKEGLLFLVQEYFKYTFSQLIESSIFIETVINDPGTKMLFNLLDLKISRDTLLGFTIT